MDDTYNHHLGSRHAQYSAGRTSQDVRRSAAGPVLIGCGLPSCAPRRCCRGPAFTGTRRPRQGYPRPADRAVGFAGGARPSQRHAPDLSRRHRAWRAQSVVHQHPPHRRRARRHRVRPAGRRRTPRALRPLTPVRRRPSPRRRRAATRQRADSQRFLTDLHRFIVGGDRIAPVQSDLWRFDSQERV